MIIAPMDYRGIIVLSLIAPWNILCPWITRLRGGRSGSDSADRILPTFIHDLQPTKLLKQFILKELHCPHESMVDIPAPHIGAQTVR